MSIKNEQETTHGLSVVIPVFNEPEWIPRTLEALVAAIERSPFSPAEIVIVDDGSAPPTADAIHKWEHESGYVVKLIKQENQGRFAARLTGISEAQNETVMLLDSRTIIDVNALSFVHPQIFESRRLVWNGYCLVDTSENLLPRFWSTITFLVYRHYLARPRLVSYDEETFDRFPKGTTHFLAPRKSLLNCMRDVESRYADSRNSNDDTLVLRRLAKLHPFYMSPEFASTYHGRTTLKGFISHAHHRGVVFFDGFSRPDNRYFPVLVSYFPMSLLAAYSAFQYPRKTAVAGVVGWLSVLSCGLVLGPSRREGATFSIMLIPFSAAFSIGLWKGLLMSLVSRFKR